MADLNSRPRRHNNCCQTGVSLTASHLLHLPTQIVAPRNVRNAERLTEHTVRLQPFNVGDRVSIQNQTGNHSLRWDRTGLVIEVKQFDQYAVKVDGSGRVTLRNRKFLRKYDKIVVDHLLGTTRTIQPLKTLKNAENLSPVNQ